MLTLGAVDDKGVGIVTDRDAQVRVDLISPVVSDVDAAAAFEAHVEHARSSRAPVSASWSLLDPTTDEAPLSNSRASISVKARGENGHVELVGAAILHDDACFMERPEGHSL